MKIFLSHSSKDADFVLPFVEFLYHNFPLEEGDIYCTSVSGQIRIGVDFIDDIRENIRTASAVIFLITEDYLDSLFCLMEMGAAWAFKDNIIPLLIPPVTPNTLEKSPLSNTQLYSLLNTETAVIALHEKFLQMGIVNSSSPNVYRNLRTSSLALSRRLNRVIEERRIRKTRITAANFISVAGGNGNPDALTFAKSSSTFNVNVDFLPNERYIPRSPIFVSLVGQFYPHQDWSILLNPKYFLHLSLSSPNNSIKRVTIEIKFGDRPSTIFSQAVDISDAERDVYLKPEDSISEQIKHISEICFVVWPQDMNESYGNLLINIAGFEKRFR